MRVFGSTKKTLLVLGVIFILIVCVISMANTTHYDARATVVSQDQEKDQIQNNNENIPQQEEYEEEVWEATHIATPQTVKAVYMSSWVAATPSLRKKIVTLIDTTELDSVVIDIKDSTGKVSFVTDNDDFEKYGSTEKRISDIKDFIAELHKKNIYVIGRISVFQDPYLAVARPDLAVTRESDGGVWKDRKGLSFLHPKEPEVWGYMVTLAKESYAVGFDEINFDYIRFPSDGNISDIDYRLGEGESRADVIETFFHYLDEHLRKEGIPISADLFGMTTTDMTTDLGIGQVLEQAMPYFDYIAPMVYPSHYPPHWNGFGNPAQYPYDVIQLSMQGAVDRAVAAGFPATMMRPWLQDFDLGATYTASMVREQIQATYDVGLNSWMMWDPGNSYTNGAFIIDEETETVVQ